MSNDDFTLFTGASKQHAVEADVLLWYVVGIGGVYYSTKMQAETEARKAFPNESADKRYARVYYKTFQEV